MKTLRTFGNFVQVSMIALALIFGMPVLAQDKASSEKPQAQSKIEMHEEMAQMHQKTADCLKGGKSEQECRQGMMAMCKEMHGGMDCPMMGSMGGMAEMHKGMKSKVKGKSQTDTKK